MNEKNGKTILKAIGSVLFAVIASSHHWLHTLLLALGLTSLGAGVFSMPPYVRVLFLVFSLAVSLWFLWVARRKWGKERPAAWVFLLSSSISVVLVVSSLPQTIADFNVEKTNTPHTHSEAHVSHHNQQSKSSTYLFTANESGSINKIDASTNEVTDTVHVEGSVHNVQLSPDGKILAATVVPMMMHGDSKAEHDHGSGNEHGHDNAMVMNGSAYFYDAATMELISKVEVGSHPAHVVYTGDGRYALVSNNESNTVTVINTSNYSVTRTIDTGNGPHGFRLTADNKFAYIANMSEDTVSVIDLNSMKETRKIKVGTAPVTTGVTDDGKTLAVTLNAENALAIVDLTTDNVTKVKVGIGPAQVYVDGKFAYVANQGTEQSPSMSMTKIDLLTKTVVSSVETGSGAHGLITSSDAKTLYVTNMFDSTVSVIDTETNEVIKTVKTDAKPNGITITP